METVKEKRLRRRREHRKRIGKLLRRRSNKGAYANASSTASIATSPPLAATDASETASASSSSSAASSLADAPRQRPMPTLEVCLRNWAAEILRSPPLESSSSHQQGSLLSLPRFLPRNSSASGATTAVSRESDQESRDGDGDHDHDGDGDGGYGSYDNDATELLSFFVRRGA